MSRRRAWRYAAPSLASWPPLDSHSFFQYAQILEKGELQVSDKERHAEYETLYRARALQRSGVSCPLTRSPGLVLRT